MPRIARGLADGLIYHVLNRKDIFLLFNAESLSYGITVNSGRDIEQVDVMVNDEPCSSLSLSGHVWQGRFKSFIIQEDVHLLMVLRYVEGNPVRAGLVNSARDWVWSSHTDRIEKSAYYLIDKVPIEIPEDWGKYVDEPLTDK
jgi:putative transposase